MDIRLASVRIGAEIDFGDVLVIEGANENIPVLVCKDHLNVRHSINLVDLRNGDIFSRMGTKEEITQTFRIAEVVKSQNIVLTKRKDV